MRQVYDRQTGNELTVTDAWLARNRRLVTVNPPKTAEPKAPRKRATSATETAPAVENPSALPDTN